MKNYHNIDKNKQLKKELINSNLSYSFLIANMLNKGSLDQLINNIENNKIKVKITTITHKKYLLNNEQFLLLLNNFIHIFKEEFYFLQNNSDYIIETLLQNKKYTKYLLCKKYIGNNKYLNYFSRNIKKLIIHGFNNNLKKLSSKSLTINNFIKDNNINLKTSMISKKEIEKNYNILLKLSMCNAKELNNYQLFEDINYYIEQTLKNIKKNHNKTVKSIEQNYINNWELMIKNYYEKKEVINILLK